MFIGTQESDKKLEELWIELWNISIDDDDNIMQDFYQWEAWTYRMAIWKWFDEQYSKWVAALLYRKSDDTEKVYVLTYSPYRWYDEIETTVLWVFNTKKLAEDAIMKQDWRYSRKFDERDFDIEEFVLNVIQ